jgi:hypothetical protein
MPTSKQRTLARFNSTPARLPDSRPLLLYPFMTSRGLDLHGLQTSRTRKLSPRTEKALEIYLSTCQEAIQKTTDTTLPSSEREQDGDGDDAILEPGSRQEYFRRQAIPIAQALAVLAESKAAGLGADGIKKNFNPTLVQVINCAYLHTCTPFQTYTTSRPPDLLHKHNQAGWEGKPRHSDGGQIAGISRMVGKS